MPEELEQNVNEVKSEEIEETEGQDLSNVLDNLNTMPAEESTDTMPAEESTDTTPANESTDTTPANESTDTMPADESIDTIPVEESTDAADIDENQIPVEEEKQQVEEAKEEVQGEKNESLDLLFGQSDSKEKKEKIKEPKESKKPKKAEPKKENKTEKKNPQKNKKISNTAKTRRLIIFISTIYLDLVILISCSKYIGYFINGLLQIIGGNASEVFESTKFTVSLLLLAILIIVNFVSIMLFKDAKKLKDKKPDDLMAILEETESIDGHRIVESEYEVNEEVIYEDRKERFRNAKTIESIDIKKVQEDFIEACLEAGVQIDKSTSRLVLSSVFSSRLLIVKEENKELRNKFLAALAKYFGSDYYMTELSDTAESFNDIAWYLTSQGNVATEFSKGILASRQNPDTVNMTMVSNVKMENITKIFKDVLGYVKNPSVPCKLKIGNRNVDNGFRALPKNLWFVFCVDNDAMLPSEVAKYSITLELNLKEAEPVLATKEHKVVSYPQVLDCINESYEDYFIEENTWKKLDEFSDYLDRRGEYFIDNRIVREMERFAAIFLALDGEQADVIDTLLCKKLLLIALPNEYKKIYEDEESLVGTAEKILGADFINNASAILKKIKMD